MLAQHRVFGTRCDGISMAVQNVEGGQDVVVFSLHLVSLPRVAPVAHDLLEARVVSHQARLCL